LLLGQLHQDLREPVRAEEFFHKAIELNPDCKISQEAEAALKDMRGETKPKNIGEDKKTEHFYETILREIGADTTDKD